MAKTKRQLALENLNGVLQFNKDGLSQNGHLLSPAAIVLVEENIELLTLLKEKLDTETKNKEDNGRTTLVW